VDIRDLLGRPSAQVRQILGPPDIQTNNVTSELYVFGPKPSWFASGTRYQTWGYRNVNGATWYLYFTPARIASETLLARLKGSGRPETDPLWETARALANSSEPWIAADLCVSPDGAIY
jgi:hypothetical protein